jgi:hypothetical protein
VDEECRTPGGEWRALPGNLTITVKWCRALPVGQFIAARIDQIARKGRVQ